MSDVQKAFDKAALQEALIKAVIRKETDKYYNSYSEYGNNEDNPNRNSEDTWDKNEEERCYECDCYTSKCECCGECGYYNCECDEVCDSCGESYNWCCCEEELTSSDQVAFIRAAENMNQEQSLFDKQMEEVVESEDQKLFNEAKIALEQESQEEFDRVAKIAKVINGDLIEEDFCENSEQDIFNEASKEVVDEKIDWCAFDAVVHTDPNRKMIYVDMYINMDILPQTQVDLSYEENIIINCDFLNNRDILIVHRAIMTSDNGNDCEGLLLIDKMDGNKSVVGAVLVENNKVELSRSSLERAGFTKDTMSVIQLGNGKYGLNGFFLQ